MTQEAGIDARGPFRGCTIGSGSPGAIGKA